MVRFCQHLVFVFRKRYFHEIVGRIRNIYYTILGMEIGKGTLLSRLFITWPNQVKLGKNCVLEHNVYFKYDGIWQPGKSIMVGDDVFIGNGCEFNIKKSISIGDNSLIAAGCRFVDHDHGIGLEDLMRLQKGPDKPIVIGKDVWLGCNVIVLKGVEIADGAIVGAGAVVTKCILQNEIWGGVPARKIGERK